jgi:hypothetical protein
MNIRTRLGALALACAFGAGIGTVSTMAAMHSSDPNAQPRTVKLCDKPGEDDTLGGCHLDYRDGSWYVTVPAR